MGENAVHDSCSFHVPGRNVWSKVSRITGTPAKSTKDETVAAGSVVALKRTDGDYLYFDWEEDLGDIWVMDVVQD